MRSYRKIAVSLVKDIQLLCSDIVCCAAFISMVLSGCVFSCFAWFDYGYALLATVSSTCPRGTRLTTVLQQI
jgi:hypothetical protein